MSTETDRMIAEAKAQLTSTTETYSRPKQHVHWEGNDYPVETWIWHNSRLYIDFAITGVKTDVPANCKLYLMIGPRQAVQQAFPVDLSQAFNLLPDDKLDFNLELRGIADIEDQMQQATWAWLQPA